MKLRVRSAGGSVRFNKDVGDWSDFTGYEMPRSGWNPEFRRQLNGVLEAFEDLSARARSLKMGATLGWILVDNDFLSFDPFRQNYCWFVAIHERGERPIKCFPAPSWQHAIYEATELLEAMG